MKTKENSCENLTDLIFTGRNKGYGAYEIRKKYEKNLFISFCISSSILLTGISVPLVASYYKSGRILENEYNISTTFEGMKKPPSETPPPAPPPDDGLLEKQSRFLKPIITIDDSVIDDNFGRQDLLNDKNSFNPLDTTDIATDTSVTRSVIEVAVKKEPWTLVEEMPFFIGGEEARLRFLSENIHYPKTAKEIGIDGTVYVEFVVEETGEISRVTILKGIGGGCDEEAARVVKLMKYSPGRQSGKAVPVRFTIPIKFVLSH
jgi:protein TonB